MDRRPSARDIVLRMMDAFGFKKQVQLAEKLGIKPPSISSAIKDGKIPDSWFDIVIEESGKTREELTRPLELIESGVRFSTADHTHVVADPGYHTDQDKRRAWLELCAKNFEVVFDFVADAYGQDAIGIQNFLDDLRDVHHSYRVWRHEQRAGRIESEKKQAGGGGV